MIKIISLDKQNGRSKRIKADDDGTKSCELKATQPSNLRDYADFDSRKGFNSSNEGVRNDGVFPPKRHSLWDIEKAETQTRGCGGVGCMRTLLNIIFNYKVFIYLCIMPL